MIASTVDVADNVRVLWFPTWVTEKILCYCVRSQSTLLHACLNAHARSGRRAEEYVARDLIHFGTDTLEVWVNSFPLLFTFVCCFSYHCEYMCYIVLDVVYILIRKFLISFIDELATLHP